LTLDGRGGASLFRHASAAASCLCLARFPGTQHLSLALKLANPLALRRFSNALCLPNVFGEYLLPDDYFFIFLYEQRIYSKDIFQNFYFYLRS
jgi:hypothetical protein